MDTVNISMSVIVLLVAMALAFDFMNGFHDAANAIATVVSTRVMKPHTAVAMAAICNVAAIFVFELKVAATVGKGTIEPFAIDYYVIFGALAGAIAWNVITWYFGIPSSSSHALIGGLMGAAFADAGPSALNLMSIVKKVVAPLLISPLAGFAVGFLMMVGISIAFFRVDRRFVNRFFRKSQMASAGIMALSHGLNDAQKTMGVITLALLIFGKIDVVHVPLWVKLACALAMAAGTAVGGWKIVKTMGHKIFKLEPVHGFAAETSAAMVIGCASAFGAPISTTHTITACIFGVGSTKRLSAVRWGIAGHLIIAWVLTIPASAAVGAVSFLLLEAFEKLL